MAQHVQIKLKIAINTFFVCLYISRYIFFCCYNGSRLSISLFKFDGFKFQIMVHLFIPLKFNNIWNNINEIYGFIGTQRICSNGILYINFNLFVNIFMWHLVAYCFWMRTAFEILKCILQYFMGCKNNFNKLLNNILSKWN